MLYEGIDIIEEIENSLDTKCEFLTLPIVISELMKLKNQRSGWRSKAAAVALRYIKSRVKMFEAGFNREYSTADDAIIDIAKNYGDEFVYATVDKELKQKLRELNVPILTWWFGRRKFVIVT